MKKILGLDLGTNSIGWALIEQDFSKKEGKILGMGSRIIPMSQDILGDFGKGNSVSQTAERTTLRSARRLRERYLLRRERLHRVLNVMGFLPEHYASEIDFEKRLGKFKEEAEPKLVYKNKMFVFKKSFEEMLADFRQYQPQILANEKGASKLIPYDWTIYYLRKKALTQRIEKEELACILFSFNQKRGYYQLRGEDEDAIDKKEYVVPLKIIQIDKGENDKKNNKKSWYSVTLENGWVYSAAFFSEPQWLNTEKEFLVTEELDENGNVKIVKEKRTDKEGKEKRRITPLPSFEEINLMSKKEQDKFYKKIKAKTETAISNSGETVGAYIYKTLLQNPNQKIRGKLIRTIERKFYKDELKRILQTQKEFHIEFQSEDLYNDCIRELYRNNDAHQLRLSKKDFVHLLLDDIIFYQPPLRSKKSSIGNCTLEYRKYKDEEGTTLTQYLKAIPRSNPYYQEFRIWQWMHNLSIYTRDNDTNVTDEFLNKAEDWEILFEFLDGRKDIEQKTLVKFFLEQKGQKGKLLNEEAEKYRWNYVEDKKYPFNETKTLMTTRLAKVKNIQDAFLTRELEQQLWHLIYSVTDKTEYEKALKSFATRHRLDETSFVEAFKKFPPFKSEYGSFSEKAIKKLLPLLRKGKYWNWNAIDEKTKMGIEKILPAEHDESTKDGVREQSLHLTYDESIQDRVREQSLHLTKEEHFQGLQLWLAQYIVYGRHSEAAMTGKWNRVADLEQYLQAFKQHSLRNPIVEQVITETLRVVKDIWGKYGNRANAFFDEIHIELGREMKNTAEDRKKITNMVAENENTNLRIKALLAEMIHDANMENVRPYSPMQQEILKIYEDGVLNSELEIDNEILEISKTAQPSSSDLRRYKLWLEQKYRSPYTGEIIPLNKLFTPEYEVEHIIPKSRHFDDSFSNKVICEAAVNKLKDNFIGLAFIKNFHGQIVECGLNKRVKIFEVTEYEDFVRRHYAKNKGKRNKLLMEEIPEKMIERQLNDTRYISKFISGVLSNIVRSETHDDGINSKNIIHGNGKITTELKQDWGLNDVWNDLILPRFERLNHLANSKHFTAWSENHKKFLPTVPLELSKGFSKKRIDHRHHAMDALAIACATNEHINYMNNEHALRKGKSKEEKQKIRYDLRANLCDKKYHEGSGKNYKWMFKKPWEKFTADAREKLESIIVSFKQNLRVINKATNHYEKWIEKDGVKVKELHKQKGVNWAIRKPMHQETVSGKIVLSRIKVPNGKILTATRKSLDTSFDLERIKKITDTGIQKILRNHLKSKDNNTEMAFSPEGIEEMNKNIRALNNGRPHQPIFKVRVFELGNRFVLGNNANKRNKYVQTKEGTNLFFAIYQDEIGKRSYETIPLNEVIEHQKQRALFSREEQKQITQFPLKGEKRNFLFSLSPDDLVYVPTEEELINQISVNFFNLSEEQKKRLYLVNDFSSTTCYFRPNRVAKAIAPKEIDMSYNEKKKKVTGSYDTKTASLEGRQIKDICIKLKVDRLGNISKHDS